jgi:hypothetical protein
MSTGGWQRLIDIFTGWVYISKSRVSIVCMHTPAVYPDAQGVHMWWLRCMLTLIRITQCICSPEHHTAPFVSKAYSSQFASSLCQSRTAVECISSSKSTAACCYLLPLSSRMHFPSSAMFQTALCCSFLQGTDAHLCRRHSL